MRYSLLILVSLLLLIGVVSADTSIIFGANNASDGGAEKLVRNTSFSLIRDNSTGTSFSTTATQNRVRMDTDIITDTFFVIDRGLVKFSRVGIVPYSATVDAASVSLYTAASATTLGDMGVNIVNHSATTPIYSNYAYSRFSTDKSISSTLSAAQYHVWTLNAIGIKNISKTGDTSFGVLLSNDIDNTAPTWSISKSTRWYFYSYDNGINTPYLTITWTPDTTPPASITNLTNTSTNCNQLSWTWTNPTDTDFAHTLIYKDNVAQSNAGNTTTTLTWSGLNPSQAYTLSTKTADLTGNINSTWVNQTATVNCPETYSWCGRQDVFFYNQSSNLTGYQKLNNVPERDIQRNITSSSITSSSGEVTLGTWITDAGSPGTTSLAPGSWDFRSYFTASSSAGNTRANYRIFNQTPNGTKTWLFFGSAITKDIISGTIPGEYQTSYARRNYTTFYPGDRLGIQINVSTDSASARTVTMDMAGNTNASMVSISYFLCPSTAAPTTTPAAVQTWQPEINPVQTSKQTT
jgi:hypothetical protein